MALYYNLMLRPYGAEQELWPLYTVHTYDVKPTTWGFNTTSNVSGRGMGGAVFGPVRPGPLTLRRKSSSTCEALQTLFGFIVSLSYIGNFRFSPVETNARK